MNGLPKNLIKHVQNTAVRLFFYLRKHDRIIPALFTIHWLPVKYWIEFQTLKHSMSANEACVLKVPKFKHGTFCKHAFTVCGPLAWNCLPKVIRLCDEIEAFKWTLKTHLFIKFVKWVYSCNLNWIIFVKPPRMFHTQFVVLYRPCKPQTKPTWVYVQSVCTQYVVFVWMNHSLSL